MMVRPFNIYDRDILHVMVSSSQLELHLQHGIEKGYCLQRLDQIFYEILAGRGVALLAHNPQPVGFLMAYITQNFWQPKVRGLHCFGLWVKPELRHSSAAYRLISNYCTIANEMKDSGRIDGYTIMNGEHSNLDYGRFGFVKQEESWSSV